MGLNTSNTMSEITPKDMLEKVKIKRESHWCIYSSSYDRGLQNLLEIWSDVIKEVPEARLHIFYGWQLFKKFYANNPERMAWMEKMNNLMTQEGVTHYGRVPQPEMEKWMKQCGIFAYPSHFREINCISAIKAQVFGCVPVVTDFAALQTTVQSGVRVQGDIYENVCLAPDTKTAYRDALIKALKDEEWQKAEREKGKEFAKKFTWDQVVSEWDEEFRKEEKNG